MNLFKCTYCHEMFAYEKDAYKHTCSPVQTRMIGDIEIEVELHAKSQVLYPIKTKLIPVNA